MLGCEGDQEGSRGPSIFVLNLFLFSVLALPALALFPLHLVAALISVEEYAYEE